MRRTIITVASTLVVVQAVKECKVFLESGGAVSTYFYVKRVQLTRMIMPSSDKQLMGIINGDLTERDVSVATTQSKPLPQSYNASGNAMRSALRANVEVTGKPPRGAAGAR
jgi:hypothetical protein